MKSLRHSQSVSSSRRTLAITAGVMALAVASATVHAQTTEMARVISSVPVMQQVAVPRQVCNTEQVMVPGQKSGAGVVMGGIAGGAIGNQIGQGSGRAAATALGLIGGAILGDRIEGGGAPRAEYQQRCTTQTVYETQAVGYNVTYEYGGKQYTVQMPQDPGPYVRLQVTPVMPPPTGQYNQVYPAAPAVAPVSPVSYVGPTVYTQETTYITPQPVYVQPRPYVSGNVPGQIWIDATFTNRHGWHHRDPWR